MANPWCLGNFWGVVQVPRLEKDAQYILLSKQGSELHGGGLVKGALLPFALPDGDAAAMMIYDCVRIGCLGNPDVDDVRLLMSNSTLSIYSLEGEHGQEELQHESPALSFPALLSLRLAGRLLVAPEREVLNPHFEDFNAYFTIHEDGDLSDPLAVCVVMDVYVPSAARWVLSDQIRRYMTSTDAEKFEVHIRICENNISGIESNPGEVNPDDVKQLYRDQKITVISVEGGDPEMVRERMDSLFQNLRIAYALGYQTAEQKERYVAAKSAFFGLQKEHRIFYDNDDVG